MSATENDTSHDPTHVSKTISTSAKWWWGGSLGIKLGAFMLGLLSLLAHMPAEAIAIGIATLTIAAELAGYKADALKGDASLLRRRLDFLDALGWPISSSDYSDLLVRRAALLRGKIGTSKIERYFASTQPQGAARAVENTMESAWWTKHLSQKMASICFVLSLLALILSFFVLYVGLLGAPNADARILAARVATSLLAFVLTFGLVKLTISYWQFAQRAAKSEQTAISMTKQPDQIEAIKLMQEYDLVRAAGPMIPDWVWARYEPTLNELWDRHRARSSSDVQTTSAKL